MPTCCCCAVLGLGALASWTFTDDFALLWCFFGVGLGLVVPWRTHDGLAWSVSLWCSDDTILLLTYAADNAASHTHWRPRIWRPRRPGVLAAGPGFGLGLGVLGSGFGVLGAGHGFGGALGAGLGCAWPRRFCLDIPFSRLSPKPPRCLVVDLNLACSADLRRCFGCLLCCLGSGVGLGLGRVAQLVIDIPCSRWCFGCVLGFARCGLCCLGCGVGLGLGPVARLVIDIPCSRWCSADWRTRLWCVGCLHGFARCGGCLLG